MASFPALRLLATAPLRDDYGDDWKALNAEVTTLNLDGTIAGDDGSTVFDGAFISAEAFALFFTPGSPSRQCRTRNECSPMTCTEPW